MDSRSFLASFPTVWVIRPEALTAFAGELHLQSVEVKPRDSQPAAEAPYRMEGPVAVVPVQGVLTKRGVWFAGVQLAASMRGIVKALRLAAADRGVKAILLDVDSPGGTVDGIEEVAEAVAAAGRMKPVYAYADGLMASAAYWLSCSAREIAAPATAEVGSIGVVMMHRECSRALEGAGVTYSVITAGHYKAAGNSVQPLTEEMRAYLQSGVDGTYEQFLQAVEQGRHVSREKALAMADGRIFSGGEALKAGLIDRVSSRSDFINHIKEGLSMTLAELREQYPEAVAELQAELDRAQASQAAGDVSAARASGVTEERGRVLALAGCLLGDQAAQRLRSLAESGVTPEQAMALRDTFAAQAAAVPQHDSMAEALTVLRMAHDSAPASPLAGVATEPGFEELVQACMAKDGCSKGEAIRRVSIANPHAHKVWLKAAQQGGNQ